MRVAIYSRYSSEGQREASIEDQNRNCERYAQREGWTIVERYFDKAISGSTAQRPGYQQMLLAAKAQAFQVLVVDDLSRLTRDEADLITTRKRLVFWGVRLIGVSDGFDTDQKSHKLHASFHGMKNELYLDELAAKTHRGLAGQALKGFNTGGRLYGYRNVPLEHATERDEYGRPKIVAVRREIDDEQAAVVRNIFKSYDKGLSPRHIVAELNRLEIPSPGASYHRRCPSTRYGTWAVTVLHGMLRNQLYVGRQIWNRRRWLRDPDTKRKSPKLRPESEWIITEQPELRIIPQDLWDRVQERIKAKSLGKWTSQKPRAPKYLLSSLLKCEVCGANFVMRSYYQYGCGGNADRGQTVCHNNLRVSRLLAEEKLLAGIRKDLFTEEGLSLFVKETTRLLTERTRQRPPQKDRLGEVEREIANLVTAIKAGIITPTTKKELERLEAERIRLQQASQDSFDNVLRVLPDAKARYQKLIDGIGSLSTKHISQAREQIRALVGEIWLKPSPEGYLVATLTGRYEGLVKLLHAGKTRLNLVGCGERI